MRPTQHVKRGGLMSASKSDAMLISDLSYANLYKHICTRKSKRIGELSDFEELLEHRDMVFEKHLKLPLDF